MMDTNKHNEDFFRELIRHGGVEKAPAGFADKVMDAIVTAREKHKAIWWQQSGTWIWSSVIFGFAILVVMVFTLDFSFMGSIFEGFEPDGSRISQFITYFGNGFIKIFEGFNISSITISIILALAALFIIDRLLRHKPRIELRMI